MNDRRRLVLLLIGVFIAAGVGWSIGTEAPNPDNVADFCSKVTYEGTGTETNPYEVSNVKQLQCIESQGLDASYELVSDIDASQTASWNDGNGFAPIGGLNFGRGGGFNGTFDGEDYNITNLTINRRQNVGMFLWNKGEIKNVSLMNAEVIESSNVRKDRWTAGGLVAFNTGTVSNSYATGSVEGDDEVGGLVGSNDGMVEKSHASMSVDGSRWVGGLVGGNQDNGTIRESHASGSVYGFNYVGGLAGSSVGTIEKSYASGPVTGSGEEGAGGLVGNNMFEGTISKSYATGSVDGSRNVGGLVGDNYRGTVSESYATGSVDGSHNVGGLVGDNLNGTVLNSYATGSVTGSEEVGSLVGSNGDGIISKSYAHGRAEGSEYAGGIVGHNGGMISESYWEIETDAWSTTSPDRPLTTSEMTGSAARNNMQGFDFNNTWVIKTNDYPVLAWQGGDKR
jgi:hypothetical protein